MAFEHVDGDLIDVEDDHYLEELPEPTADEIELIKSSYKAKLQNMSTEIKASLAASQRQKKIVETYLVNLGSAKNSSSVVKICNEIHSSLE